MKRGRNQRRRQGPNPNRALDSNGPDVRIRGTANQIHDKYLALARDASSSGDRVKAESYLQHAEHYFRLIRSMQPPQAQTQQPEGQQPTEEEQPSVDGAGEQRQGRQPREKRKPADETQTAAKDDASDAKDSAPSTTEAGEEQTEERKPRRRRAPRRAAKKEESASDEEAAPAAAE